MEKNDFGNYVRYLRNERGYTLRQLAEMLNISPYYLSYIETGKKTNPSNKIIAQMFISLKMSKVEIEKFFDLYAKANGCVSCDLVDYIMQNDDVREYLRSSRDALSASPSWEDFISKFLNNNG